MLHFRIVAQPGSAPTPTKLSALLAALGLATIAACSSAPETAPEAEISENQDTQDSPPQEELLSEAHQNQLKRLINKEGYPAIVLGIVDGDSSQLYSFGSLESGEEPQKDTLFEIGSITKSFTSLLLADAALAGQLAIDDPVQDLVPDLQIPKGEENQITLQMLATHYSGLPPMPPNMEDAHHLDPFATYGVEDLQDMLKNYTLPREPGEEFEYSNVGYGLLGYALSQKAGKDYDELLNTKVFEPLHMSSTYTYFHDVPAEQIAPGHSESGDPLPNWNFGVLASAGSILSNAQDMLRYLQAQMGASDHSLQEAMTITQKKYATGPPELGNIGLGWMINEQSALPIIWHSGGTGGYRSFLGFFADGSRGVFLMTNIAKPINSSGFAILLNEDAPAGDQDIIDLSPEELDEYVGVYALAPNFHLTVDRQDSQLYAQATGQGAFPIYPREKDKFFATVASIEITFERDDDQEVTGLILHQNGDTPARRLSQEEIDELQAERTEIELPVETLEEYVGKYQLTPQHIVTVTLEGNQLFVALTGQPAAPVYPSAKDHFFYKIVDAQVVFERDEDDQVVAFVLHQNGVQRAPRIEDD